MPVDGLHPSLRALLKAQGWDALTGAQSAAWKPIRSGKHTLLVAPTGHGKTEAALIPVLDRLLHARDKAPLPTGFLVLYVTPLRALNRDLLGRLTSWGKALGLEVGVRHGDTSQAERSRQARKPPAVLITTPETLQLLLYGDTLRTHLGAVQAVVIDEIHDMAGSERGAQLMAALERVEEVVAQGPEFRAVKAKERTCPPKPKARARGEFQRIGLSATVADPQPVAAFMAGPREAAIVVVAAPKELTLRVVSPDTTEDDVRLGAELSLPPPVMAQVRTVRDIVAAHERVLVFHNTRDGAELLVSRSGMLDEEAGNPPMLGLHHGSLSAEHRMDIEDQFKHGTLRCLVATSSLELGIDIGAIDHVIQVQSPRSVARLVQRMGRAGHRVGLVSDGTLLASGFEDALECQAIAKRAMEGRLEPLIIRESPLVVLANQLIALTNEYAELNPTWARAVLCRAAPFADLDEGMFQAVWDTLIDVQSVYEGAPGNMGRSGRQRRHFLEHVSLIPDERTYRIVDEGTKRSIGTVDDAYVAAALHPGALFVMAGRSWRVLEVEAERERVRVAPAKDLGMVPQWTGGQLPVSYEVAQETAALRPAHVQGGPVAEQVQAGLAIPTNRRVTLEIGRGLLVANVALGTRGNETLGRITAALLYQRIGAPVGMDSDAYRIHFTPPTMVAPADVEELWRTLDIDTLDLLLGMVLRNEPVVRHHLVHVAKHFGAVPKALDPNRFTRVKMDELWSRLALQEESLSRLLHDRLDVPAVQQFLRDLQAGAIEVVAQGLGPISRLGRDEMRNMMAAPRSDERLLAEVRRRIEESDVLLVCTQCFSKRPMTVADVPRKVHCRRCQSQQVACLRPWQEDAVKLLKAKGDGVSAEDKRERHRIIKNGVLVGNFGPLAARCLAARGVGPDTAARILQKTQDPESPAFWREILQAELTYAQTNAFWKRK